MFSGSDIARSRKLRLTSTPPPPIAPRAENSGTSCAAMNNAVTSMTGSPAGEYAATGNVRMIPG